jgi:4-amino-4-deoxy-L-arabinose transferase-like glycosyltransferase
MPSAGSSTPGRKSGPLALLLGLAALAFLLLLRLFWVGFLGSDDEAYWGGATGWLTQFPYLGHDHWTLRHTLVIPMALARLGFGNSMAAMFLPTVLYAIALISLLGLWTWRSAGVGAAALAVALLITDPQLVLLSSTADVDIPEAFFIVAAFFVSDRVMERAGNMASKSSGAWWGSLLLAGIFMGLAMLSRETAVFAVAALGLLFLAGFGMDRSRYFVLGAGCALVLGLETLWLWSATGNWFYRSTIDVNHDQTINRWLDQGASIPFIHPLIDPVTMLLLNHNFGLMTWIGVPLIIWLFTRRMLSGAARRQAVLLTTLALAWTILAAGLWKLLPLTPRYYMLPSIMVCVLSGMALAKLWQTGRRKLAAVLAILFVGGNLAALSLDNRTFMFGVYTLVDVASRQQGVVHTDIQTSRRANLLLEWAGTRDRVVNTPARSGDLFFFNPTMAGSGVKPPSDWTVVERHPIPESGARWIACRMPSGLVPQAMVAKFRCGNDAAILFRVS